MKTYRQVSRSAVDKLNRKNTIGALDRAIAAVDAPPVRTAIISVMSDTTGFTILVNDHAIATTAIPFTARHYVDAIEKALAVLKIPFETKTEVGHKEARGEPVCPIT